MRLRLITVYVQPPVEVREVDAAALVLVEQLAHLRFRSQVSGLGTRVSDFGFLISGFWFRVSGFGFWVSGFGFRVSVFGFWVDDVGEDLVEQGRVNFLGEDADRD